MRLGIRELRANAALMVRRASSGERITVTVGGRPVAQLGPIDDPTAGLDALIASGQVIAPRRDPALFDHRQEPLPVFAGARLDRLLRELRG